VSIERVWQDLLDKDDRTSPEEYPDMVLITREELASAAEALAVAGCASPCREWKAEAEKTQEALRLELEPVGGVWSLADVARQLRRHLFTHLSWADWFEKNPKDPTAKDVGDARFHRKVEAAYRSMIVAVEAQLSPAELRIARSERPPAQPDAGGLPGRAA
jgi:hypothetical protein